MKALTIRQPWAWLILHGGKDIENRDWFTGIRGRVAIHASAKLDYQEWTKAALLVESQRRDGRRVTELPKAAIVASGRGYRFASPPEGVVLGAVVGTVEIVDCVASSASPWFFGKYGFVLRDPVVFETPVPAKGALGWWDWEERAA